jgi:lipopolysaccharide/colanic/teichoic acid biosynthesis glycosyltransferase
LSANLFVPAGAAKSSLNEAPLHISQAGGPAHHDRKVGRKAELKTHFSLTLVDERVSSWSQSGIKRTFDFLCVLAVLPFLIPIFFIIALSIRFTSRGPVLFLQTRTGRRRRNFTILKFRTMEHCERGAHKTVTTTENQRFTPVGPFLRHWKLDELPQLLNVLMGDMSLVGPRPKLPEHQLGNLLCRPGITGAATIAFAREEQVLAGLPDHRLDGYYHSIILPAKLRLDTEYMARATFLSDLKLVVDTALRRWDTSAMYRLLDIATVDAANTSQRFKSPLSTTTSNRVAAMPPDESLVSAD